jgi:hypothetical protein
VKEGSWRAQKSMGCGNPESPPLETLQAFHSSAEVFSWHRE